LTFPRIVHLIFVLANTQPSQHHAELRDFSPTPVSRRKSDRGQGAELTLTAQDNDRLSTLARAAANTKPDVAACLTDELDRANVLGKGRHPGNIVYVGCEVEFRDYATVRFKP
jgi:hypothetical protein